MDAPTHTRDTNQERLWLEGQQRSAIPASGVPSRSPRAIPEDYQHPKEQVMAQYLLSSAGRPLLTELAGRCTPSQQQLAPRSGARGLDALGARRPRPFITPTSHAPTGHAPSCCPQGCSAPRWPPATAPPTPRAAGQALTVLRRGLSREPSCPHLWPYTN